MAKNQITRQELDVALDPAGANPESFDACAKSLIASDRDLEVLSPKEWRTPGAAAPQRQASFLQQFRRDVDSIITHGRDEEAQLARSTEFAQLRFNLALVHHGLTQEDVDQGLAHPGTGWSLATADSIQACSALPAQVARRWLELHALRTEMVERNLYLVPINVERYAKTGASRTDLTQEGSIALFRAVDGFDWRRGLLFRTYAVHWLNQAFRNYLYNFGNTVRIPVYLQKAMKHVASARSALGNTMASVSEIAEAGDLEERLVKSAIRATRTNYSLDAELGSAGGNRLGDLLEDKRADDKGLNVLDHADLSLCFSHAFRELTEREQRVVRLRFGMGYDQPSTLSEVSVDVGLSVERVRQIQIGALRKLGAPAMRKRLEVFLN